jgi:hypothetical protein
MFLMHGQGLRQLTVGQVGLYVRVLKKRRVFCWVTDPPPTKWSPIAAGGVK